MGKIEVKTGDVYGRLTVIKEVEPYVSPSGKKARKFLVQCDCGSDPFEVTLNNLRRGRTTSCGCVHKEKTIERNKDNHKTNTYDLTNGDYGIGYTSKGEEFYFDLEDFDLIKDYCWYINAKGYVVTNEADTNKPILFHRLVMNCTEGMDIDHRFHKVNDNRKSQLREVTHSQNCMNRGIAKRNSSGVVGVSWHKARNKWIAKIYVNGKQIYLGAYINIEDAIQSRKDAELEYFGEYRYKDNKVGNE